MIRPERLSPSSDHQNPDDYGVGAEDVGEHRRRKINELHVGNFIRSGNLLGSVYPDDSDNVAHYAAEINY